MDQRILHALKAGGGLSATAVMKKAGVGKRERERFYRTLQRLVRDGKIMLRQGEYALSAPAGKLLEATVGNVHEKFGFVREDASGEELFVPGRALLGALPGDKVLLRERPGRGDLREGEVVKILQEGDFVFTGVLHRGSAACTVSPDSGLKGEVAVAPGQARGAKDGDKVVARISKRGERHRDHKAQVLAATGPSQDARACAAAILKASGVRPGFEADVEKEARRLAQAGIPATELEGRRDLRDMPIFTIDSAHSKDLDDAVSLKKLEHGWEVGVHIADVSHYVRPRGPLDREAYERGTSIYFADQVIPMLPPALSNGICSLNEGEDRLALSALLTLDENGDRTGYTFCKSVIRSRVKGVYSEVNAILAGTAAAAVEEKYGPLCQTLREMDALAQKLVKKRTARGAIDLSSVESQMLFDEAGQIIDIVPRRQGRAESLIEEFMLLANGAAAAFGEREKLPFIYRIHEAPPQNKVDALFELLGRLGIPAKKPEGQVPPALLRDILESVRGTDLETIVNGQILRSMSKARYSEVNVGHYGLTVRRYSHFTSPIRRYPDLAIHRIISERLAGAAPAELAARYETFAKGAAEQSSQRELRAMTIERDCSDCFMAQYMRAHVGQCYDGVIGSVAPHGLYVLLPNSVEGLVHINTLEDDSYDYDGAVSLTGRLTGRRLRVGDAVRVMVVRADVSSGQIDFSLAEPGKQAAV